MIKCRLGGSKCHNIKILGNVYNTPTMVSGPYAIIFGSFQESVAPNMDPTSLI